MVLYWLDKGIIILQCGKMYVYSVGSAQDGKVDSFVFFSPPPSAKNPPYLPSLSTPHKTCVLAQAAGREGVSSVLRSSAPSYCQCFSLCLEGSLEEGGAHSLA